MAGLLEERDEVIKEGKEKDSVAADLALIASAQKVEHYEISAYGTARAIAGQIGLPAVGALLSKSLAEEEIADNLLTQMARELMSESRTRSTKEPKHAIAAPNRREAMRRMCVRGLDRGRAPFCARPRLFMRPRDSVAAMRDRSEHGT